jgi:hypothetical protein
MNIQSSVSTINVFNKFNNANYQQVAHLIYHIDVDQEYVEIQKKIVQLKLHVHKKDQLNVLIHLVLSAKMNVLKLLKVKYVVMNSHTNVLMDLVLNQKFYVQLNNHAQLIMSDVGTTNVLNH